VGIIKYGKRACILNIKSTQKLKPVLVTSYNIWPGNGMGENGKGWKSKKTDEVSKKGKKEKKRKRY